MLRKLTIITLMLAVSALTYAQDRKVEQEKKQIAKDEVSATVQGLQKPAALFPVKNNPQGDTVGETKLPIFANSVNRVMIDYYDGVPYMVPMVIPNSVGNRSVTLFYPKSGDYKAVELPYGTATNRSGWGALDIGKTGENLAGYLAAVAHVPNKFFLFDIEGEAFSAGVDVEANTDPSVSIVGDNIFVAVSGNREQFKLFKSEDLGDTFTQIDSILAYHPSPIYSYANGGVEIELVKSPNEQYVLWAGTNEGEGHVNEGVSKDSADNVWYILSTDAGETWTAKVIGWDGDLGFAPSYTPTKHFTGTNVAIENPGGTPDTLFVDIDHDVDLTYAAFFENFGQIAAAVDNQGIVHIVCNGYGFGEGVIEGLVPTNKTDTTVSLEVSSNLFPVLYWNSRTEEWKAISNEEIDILPNSIMATLRPGNGIGQSWPSLGVDKSGTGVFVAWCMPQITADTVDISPTQFFTDVAYVYSKDGGATFTAPEVLSGKKEFGELPVVVARELEETNPGELMARLMYLENPGPNFYVTDGSGPTCNIIYKTYTITGVSVKDENVAVNKYELSQNYPNPFNPSTIINFSIPKSGLVELKVYDILGREVANLVNEVKEAGSHSVTFNASKLSSGVYMYSLKSGDFSIAKKMMLIK